MFAINAQQEAGAPAALRTMLAPAASVAAAVLTHAQQRKPPTRLPLSGAPRGSLTLCSSIGVCRSVGLDRTPKRQALVGRMACCISFPLLHGCFLACLCFA